MHPSVPEAGKKRQHPRAHSDTNENHSNPLTDEPQSIQQHEGSLIKPKRWFRGQASQTSFAKERNKLLEENSRLGLDLQCANTKIHQLSRELDSRRERQQLLLDAQKDPRHQASEDVDRYQKTDEFILCAFHSLVTKVKNWVRGAVLPTWPARSEHIMPPEAMEIWRQVVPHATNTQQLHQYLCETRSRKNILTGVVFLMIASSMFGNSNPHTSPLLPKMYDHWLTKEVRNSIHVLETQLRIQGLPACHLFLD